MNVLGRRGRAAIVLAATVGMLAAGCGDDADTNADSTSNTDSSDSSGSTGEAEEPKEEVTLRVNLFGRFGYTDLYEKYMEENPHVTIVETAEGDLGKYNQQLVQRLAAGSGAGDVVAIEEGQVVGMLQAPEKFVNLQEHGATELKDTWLPWKWDQATTADGSYTIGLGTDVGGLAMCYRRDLFEQAGLPTDREELGQMWQTWDDFIEVGKQFQEGIGDDNIKFLDAATNNYNAILMQGGGETYFSKDDELIIDSNPVVRDAWDTVVEMSEAGLSAQLKAFSPEWNAGFKNGAFATVACPAWMTGYIEGQAGEETAGKWDIATVPGGGGNWGGSFLGVPSDSENQEEAIKLVTYLTTPESMLTAFEAEGVLPSSPTLYEDPALLEKTHPYFNDAPIGELFVEGAKNLEPVYLGAKNQPVRDAVENALRAVEQGQLSADEGWTTAVQAAKTAAR